MSRMAVVGCEASGKTVFMSAMTDYYRPQPADANRPCLVPENPAANRFGQMLRRMMRFQRQWPPATNPGKTVELDWTLRGNGRTLADIGMLEFGGETFRSAFRGEDGEGAKKQAVKDLNDYLRTADFIVVLVSIRDLMREPGESTEEEFERDTEALWVTRGILEFVRDRIMPPGIVIGLTQADRYRTELAEAGGAAALFAKRWPTVRAAAPEVPVVEVASVSRTDAEGRPDEGYLTDGILPVMREMVRQTYGDTTELVKAMAADRAEIEAMKMAENPLKCAAKVKKLVAKYDRFVCAAAICGEEYARESAEVESAIERYKTALKTIKRPPAKRKKSKKSKKSGKPAVRRVYLLALLLAAVVAFGVQYGGWGEREKVGRESRSTAEVAMIAVDGEKQEVKEQKPEVDAKTVETFSNRLARATAGDVKCKRWLGHQYYGGSSMVEKDLVKARSLYREAAEGGDAKAQLCLAVMCEKGEGGETNLTESAKWYDKAKAAGIVRE